MELYRKVKTSDRLPIADGQYMTETGFQYITKGQWAEHDDFLDPNWWLEEINTPSVFDVYNDAEIALGKEGLPQNYYYFGMGASCVISKINSIKL